MTLRNWLSSTAIGALVVAGGAAWADPPQRVGRVAYIRGDVSIQQSQQEDWSPAIRNYPVTQDEAFWTERGANAELQIGPIEVFLDGETEFDVDQLDYGVTQFSLPEGAVHIEMARVPEGGVRIETPQGEVRLTTAGAYRIDAGASDDRNPESLLVTVLSGHAEIAGPGVRVPIDRGQMGTVDNGYRVSISAGRANDLDDFAHRQLSAERYNDAPVYVSDEYSGYEDLNAYGDWENTSEFGRVWYPRAVAADWAPYHYGHWAHVAPWGWTWIDDAQWGFTPFHYGRWTQVRGRWCWAPGERVARPVYAPALVSFIGGGPGVGISIGWVPLAPREIYRPYYSVSTTYVRNINITTVDRRVVNTLTVENIRNARDTNAYHNDHARTFVRQDDFARAAPVQRAALQGPPPQAGGRAPQPFDVSKVPATPQARAGFSGSDRAGVSPRGHAPRNDERRIVIKPPAANVVPQTPTAAIANPTNRPGQPDGRPDFQRGDQSGGAASDRRDRGGQYRNRDAAPKTEAILRPDAPINALPPAGSIGQDRRRSPGQNAGQNTGQNAGQTIGENPRAFNRDATGSSAQPGNAYGNEPRDEPRDRSRRGAASVTGGAGGSPPPAPAPQVQIQAPPQVQPAPQPPQPQQGERRFDGNRRPGQPAAQAEVNDAHGSPGNAGGRFGAQGGGDAGERGRDHRGGPPQGAPLAAAPPSPAKAAEPAPQPEAQQKPAAVPKDDAKGDRRDRRHRDDGHDQN